MKSSRKWIVTLFAVLAIVIVIIVLLRASTPPEEGEFEPNPAKFLVGQTTITYNNTTGWWALVPVTYDYDCYVECESQGCLNLRFTFHVELANGTGDNWTSDPEPLVEIPEGYENTMTIELRYPDRQPVSVSLMGIECA